MAEKYSFSYTLTEKEITEGLKYSGVYKTVGKRAAIETAALGAFFVFFIVTFIMRREFFDIVMAVITFLATMAVTFLPRLDIRKEAKKAKKDVSLRISKERVTAMGSGEPLAMSLDGTTDVRYVEKAGLILLRTSSGGFLIIPERALPKGGRQDIMDMLLNSEEPYEGDQ